MNRIKPLIVCLLLSGCATTSIERRVDNICSYLPLLPIPFMEIILGNTLCIFLADQAAAHDEEQEDKKINEE